MSTMTTMRGRGGGGAHRMPPAMAALPAGPGWLPGPRQGTIDREPLWYAWAAGLRGVWPWADEAVRASDLEPVPIAPVADRLRRPGGRIRFADVAVHDAGRSSFGVLPGHREATESALAAVAVDALREVRRDPADPYNDHRGYASARCQFPVTAAVGLQGTWWVVDPASRSLVDTGMRSPGPALVLTGSPVGMPRVYRWFRGTLVTLETGIVLRHLAVVAAHHGITLELAGERLGRPGTGISAVWAEPGRWSRPLLLTPAAPSEDGRTTDAETSPPVAPVPLVPRTPVGDASLEAACDLLHRTPWRTGRTLLGSGMAPGAERGGPTLDEVVFARSAGRMPGARHGFRLHRGGVEDEAAQDLVSWMTVAAPDAIRAEVSIRLLRNDVGGAAPDVLRIDLPEDGRARLRTLPPCSPAALAKAYGYPASAFAGSDVARSPLVALVTGRPGEGGARRDPSIWTRLIATAGWAVHGGCLAMALHGLVARPVRAFDDRLLRDAVGLDPDEMPLLALIVGRPHPHGEPQVALPR